MGAWLSTREVAEQLGVSPRWVREQARTNPDFPRPMRVGRVVRHSAADLGAFIEANRSPLARRAAAEALPAWLVRRAG